MLKNRPTRKARKERKKRIARNELCSSVTTAYREKLATAPDDELKAVRRTKASRLARITAKRKPKAEPFYIGGTSK